MGRVASRGGLCGLHMPVTFPTHRMDKTLVCGRVQNKHCIWRCLRITSIFHERSCGERREEKIRRPLVFQHPNAFLRVAAQSKGSFHIMWSPPRG